MIKTGRYLKLENKQRGFTVIEVLVSLVLVLMVVLGVLRMISAAYGSYRNVGEAFRMHQRIDEFRARLLSESFDSVKWQTGEYSLQDQYYEVNWRIHQVTPSLKVAHLSFRRKRNGFTRRSSVYKSLHIRAGW